MLMFLNRIIFFLLSFSECYSASGNNSMEIINEGKVIYKSCQSGDLKKCAQKDQYYFSKLPDIDTKGSNKLVKSYLELYTLMKNDSRETHTQLLFEMFYFHNNTFKSNLSSLKLTLKELKTFLQHGQNMYFYKKVISEEEEKKIKSYYKNIGI